MRENEAYVVDDVDADERVTEADRDAYEQTQIQSVICVPLHKDGTFTSVMAVHQRTPREWQPHEVDLVTTVVQRCWESLQRARTVRELRESEEQYRTLFESIDEGFCVIEKTETGPDEPVDFRYLEANPALETQTGLSDVVGDMIHGVLPEEAPKWCNIYDTVLKTGEPTRFEQTLETEGRILELCAFPLDNEERRVGVIFQDVTERRETQEALRESEERLRLALDAAEMGVWELDLRTKKSPVHSPRHDEIFGYEEALDDWSIERFLDHVHPDDRERLEQSFEDAFERGDWNFECRIVRADDEQRWIRAEGKFYSDGDGEPARAVGIVQNITERKERERALQESEQRYRTLAENFPNGGVGVYDEDLRYTLVTGTMWNDIDPDAKDIQGNTIWEALPPETAADVEPIF